MWESRPRNENTVTLPGNALREQEEGSNQTSNFDIPSARLSSSRPSAFLVCTSVCELSSELSARSGFGFFTVSSSSSQHSLIFSSRVFCFSSFFFAFRLAFLAALFDTAAAPDPLAFTVSEDGATHPRIWPAGSCRLSRSCCRVPRNR
jgi:hypothetical protein